MFLHAFVVTYLCNLAFAIYIKLLRKFPTYNLRKRLLYFFGKKSIIRVAGINLENRDYEYD